MLEDFLYNIDIVQREHKYRCTLANTASFFKYPSLLSKSEIFEVQLTGQKTGYCRKQDFFDDKTELKLQASHLQMFVRIPNKYHLKIKDLSFAVDTTPSYMNYFFVTLVDIDAFRLLIESMENPDYMELISFVTKIFVDWKNLDAKKEHYAALSINRRILQHLYSPDKVYYKKKGKATLARMSRMEEID